MERSNFIKNDFYCKGYIVISACKALFSMFSNILLCLHLTSSKHFIPLPQKKISVDRGMESAYPTKAV
jgi:hypothetical protein